MFLTSTLAAHARRYGVLSQGAFYVLGEQIVQHLARSRDLLTVMSVEDAMVGVWLLGIDKVRSYVLCSRQTDILIITLTAQRNHCSGRLYPQRPYGQSFGALLTGVIFSPPCTRLRLFAGVQLLSPDWCQRCVA